MRTRLFALLLALLPALAVHAQRPPMKWGEVPAEQLAMTDFPADTNAAAVVLGAFGETYFDSNWNQVYKVHRRVKLLRESSYEDYGTVKIYYYAGRNGTRINNLKAQTLVPGPDGAAVVHKVDRKSIFKERIGRDGESLTFTFPALQPGAIVEFSYEAESPFDPFLEPWRFQEGEPVLASEYRVEFPAALAYIVSAVGGTFGKLTANESSEATRPGGRYARHRWAMENVPALREEPFMTTPRDYRMALEFQLQSVNVPGWGPDAFMSTWPSVAESFLGPDGRYGRHLNSVGRDVKSAAALAVADATDPVEKMKRVYEYVRTRVEFVGEGGTYAEKAPADVLKDGQGDSPEINLLLVALLREAGLAAHPALISTRGHGAPRTTYPLITQFDDLIVAVEVGSQRYFLDGASRHRPFDMLPFNSLNGQAWVVRHPNPVWAPVEAVHKHTLQQVVTLALDADGRASGHAQARAGGYAALFTRADLDDTDDVPAYVREHVFDDYSGLTLDSVSVVNPDDVGEGVTFDADFAIESYAQQAGDFIYLRPVLLGRWDENPLKAPERLFDVDMGYARDQVYAATITVPEGYAVSEVPPNRQFGMAGGGALFKRLIEADGGVLRVTNRVTIAKPVFPASQYAALREFYDRVVAAFAEQVVLQRTDAPAGQ